MMKKGGKGGARTMTGLKFERNVGLYTAIEKQTDYIIQDNKLYKNTEKKDKKQFATFLKKNNLYKFLKEHDIDYKDSISKKLLPDDAILIQDKKVLYIIEIKFQGTAGSTDEKLQTCDFKIKQYRKLLSPLKLKIEFIYILNDWFKNPNYKDVLEYINSVEGCSYYFNELPLNKIGL